MSDDPFLTRLTLRRNAEVSALIETLAPHDEGQAAETGHRLVWSVMAPEVQAAANTHRLSGNRQAELLWRRESRDVFYVLGPRPVDHSSLFEIETKPFQANLRPDDRLEFLLRLHATVDRRTGGRETRQRLDIVHDAIKDLPQERRAPERMKRAGEAADRWLARRGEADGFFTDAVTVDAYRVQPLARNRNAQGIGILDLRGVLTVREPQPFLARIAAGFGRAKAFGCGLMLIRRAQLYV